MCLLRCASRFPRNPIYKTHRARCGHPRPWDHRLVHQTRGPAYIFCSAPFLGFSTTMLQVMKSDLQDPPRSLRSSLPVGPSFGPSNSQPSIFCSAPFLGFSTMMMQVMKPDLQDLSRSLRSTLPVEPSFGQSHSRPSIFCSAQFLGFSTALMQVIIWPMATVPNLGNRSPRYFSNESGVTLWDFVAFDDLLCVLIGDTYCRPLHPRTRSPVSAIAYCRTPHPILRWRPHFGRTVGRRVNFHQLRSARSPPRRRISSRLRRHPAPCPII